MKNCIKYFIPAILCAMAMMSSCSKDGDDVETFASGTCIARASVGAGEGSLSVSVETAGTWRLSCQEPWLSFDVEGGAGSQAFTVYYESNSSDILNLRPSRVAKIAISLDTHLVSDTLVLVQQGFLGGEVKSEIRPDSRISLEFDNKAVTEARFICCSSEGLDDDSALRTWLDERGADAFVLDGNVEGSLPGGIRIAGCNFAGLTESEEYIAFKQAVDGSVNSSFEGGTQWIVAGQMYHLSSMQTSYPSSPGWYPADAKGEHFRSDRYAWQNNLFDVAWMYAQDYVSTYTDTDSHSYSADYVYVSSSVLDMVSSVQIVNAPVSGMAHKAIIVEIKY